MAALTEEQQRLELIGLLGKHPQVPIKEQVLSRQVFKNYTLEVLALTLNDVETVPAYFAYPNQGQQPYPTVIYNHSHGGDFVHGKAELINGAVYLQQPSFLDQLINMGYAVGCIDMFAFGDRQGKKESELVKEFSLYGRTLWGMRLFDNQRFIDYLITRTEVDQTRLATIGMSMGGMMSWWLAAIDPRIKVTVDIAGQVDLETLIDVRGLDHHGFYYYVPNLLTHFTTAQIQALIIPRYRLSLVGKNDNMCPQLGVIKLNKALQEAYQLQNCPGAIESYSLTGGHQETSEMRYRWVAFMKRYL